MSAELNDLYCLTMSEQHQKHCMQLSNDKLILLQWQGLRMEHLAWLHCNLLLIFMVSRTKFSTDIFFWATISPIYVPYTLVHDKVLKNTITFGN